MKRLGLFIWVLLVAYTLVYLLIWGSNTVLLNQMINGEADPFAFAFFNLMGLFPCYFFYDYWSFLSRKRYGWVPFVLGFAFGAYAILIGYHLDAKTGSTFPLKRTFRIALIAIIGLTLAMMVYGIGMGNPTAYLQAWTTDTLVGIMAVDFIVLYGWSIIRSRSLSTSWLWSFLPLIGFGIVLWNSSKRVQPVA